MSVQPFNVCLVEVKGEVIYMEVFVFIVLVDLLMNYVYCVEIVF